MSLLRIRVDKFLESDGGPPPRVFARIQRLDPSGRSVANTVEHVLVPISDDPTQGVLVPLNSGRYSVEVNLPSGEWLSDAVRVMEDGQQELVLAATSPARDWLSWPHLSNAMREPQAVFQTSRRALPGPPNKETRSRSPRIVPYETRVKRSVGLWRSAQDQAASLFERAGLYLVGGVVQPILKEPADRWERTRFAELEVGRPLYWLSGGPTMFSVDVLRGDPWRTLSGLRGATTHIVEVLNAGRSQRVVEPAIADDASAIFPIPTWSEDDVGFAPRQRTFAAVHRRQGVELISLPMPWVNQFFDREVTAEITVQRPRYEREFASAVSVRDQQLAVLLGYLSSGAFPAAKRLAEAGGDMLYEKNINPLAAAAGGYALVSSAADTQPQRWHQWVENLMERFEDLPDGAIQYGTMRMRLRTSEEDVDEASRAFKLAYHRGLPFYGLGLRWLLEGLQRVGTRDKEARAMAESVQRLTARLHPTSPFTILRLGKR